VTRFDDLSHARHLAQRFVIGHRDSLRSFHDETTGVFRAYPGESLDVDGKRVRHITTTNTCYESLLDVADLTTQNAVNDATELLKYSHSALDAPSEWRSEGAGFAYCRARSLGAITRYASQALTDHPAATAQLLTELWAHPQDEPLLGAYGVREFTNDPSEVAASRLGPPSYPVNAYHTYWATTALVRTPIVCRPDSFDEHLRAGIDRLRLILTEQIAQHDASSSHVDPQQLAWAIAGVAFHSTTDELIQGSETYHILLQGLKTLFAQQNERGDWARGGPLFNYKVAGNAYCYVFETMGELLTVASDPTVPVSKNFRNLLEPFWPNLVRLLQYADATALTMGEGLRGWVSGHRPNSRVPESWATASVFRFGERLRVLLGKWTNQEARRQLGARRTELGSADLQARGGTWNLSWGSAGEQLSAFYALPTLVSRMNRHLARTYCLHDPDAVVLPGQHGRSAILFGPPGTGKNYTGGMHSRHFALALYRDNSRHFSQ
jgi:hypothetical protein